MLVKPKLCIVIQVRIKSLFKRFRVDERKLLPFCYRTCGWPNLDSFAPFSFRRDFPLLLFLRKMRIVVPVCHCPFIFEQSSYIRLMVSSRRQKKVVPHASSPTSPQSIVQYISFTSAKGRPLFSNSCV